MNIEQAIIDLSDFTYQIDQEKEFSNFPLPIQLIL